MDNNAIAKTQALAPILRGLEQAKPDWKDISIMLLHYFDFEELSYALADRRQDWQAIAQALLPRLKEESAWIRIQSILSVLSESPQELDQLAQASGLGRTTISQTINALDRGGYSIPFEQSGDQEGRPRKAFSRHVI
jgi:biotin operon repressor